MRVIAGEFRSRRLKSIPGMATRPTPDRLRETLFNILAFRIPDAIFLDGYAGTGAVGIEALSRGARHVYFLEKARPALEVLRDNLHTLGLETRSTVVTAPVLLALEKHEAQIVFLDPPYEKVREYRAVLDLLSAKPPELTIVQHSVHQPLEEAYGALHRTLSFYTAV
jgi:16S rRNA (guanine(966)-N(2))-methyltransferase RsmD